MATKQVKRIAKKVTPKKTGPPASSRARTGAPSAEEHAQPEPSQPAPHVADVATDVAASPFVDDGGIIGVETLKFGKPIHAAAAPTTPAAPALDTPTSDEPSAPAPAAPQESPSPAPNTFRPTDTPAPAAAAQPAMPRAAEMNIPLSAEEQMMQGLSDEDEPDTDPNPAGDIGATASNTIASTTADFLLKTFGLISNELIVDLTNVNENVIETAINDKQLPPEVLADVRLLNKQNAKAAPFKAEYRDMLKPHLQRFCAVSGVENLSPGMMLIAVAVVVLAMMGLDYRKRVNERERFMNRLLKKYAQPADVVESTLHSQA